MEFFKIYISPSKTLLSGTVIDCMFFLLHKYSSSPQLKKSLENVMEDPQFVLRDAYSRFLSVAVTCKMEVSTVSSHDLYWLSCR